MASLSLIYTLDASACTNNVWTPPKPELTKWCPTYFSTVASRETLSEKNRIHCDAEHALLPRDSIPELEVIARSNFVRKLLFKVNSMFE